MFRQDPRIDHIFPTQNSFFESFFLFQDALGDPLVIDARPKYWGRKKRGVIAITPPSLALQRRCLDDKTSFSNGTVITLPETNIAPKNGWLEYYFPIGEAYFQGLR